MSKFSRHHPCLSLPKDREEATEMQNPEKKSFANATDAVKIRLSS